MDKQLISWLESNLIDYEVKTENTFEIKDFGLFFFVKREKGEITFDQNFKFFIKEEEYSVTCDYYAFKFGERFYYIKSDLSEIKFNQLKYLSNSSDQSSIDFAHIGIHSGYEMLSGSGSYKEWCKKAKFLGIKTLGIAEKNTLAGTFLFQQTCQENNIAPIQGATYTIKDGVKTYDLKFYVSNEKGWRNILRINSQINVFSDDKTCDINILSTYSSDLFCVLPQSFNVSENFELLRKIKSFSFVDVYYQIDSSHYASQEHDKKVLISLKEYLNSSCFLEGYLKPILISDSYYLDSEYQKIRKCLNDINKDSHFFNYSFNQYFKSFNQYYSELDKIFKDKEKLLSLIEAGNETLDFLVSACKDFIIDSKRLKLPKYRFKDDERPESGSTEEFFLKLLDDNFESRIGEMTDDERVVYKNRLEEEIRVIKKGGFVDYFLIIWDIMNFCEREEIFRGLGRGSAAGSLVSFILGIVDVNPVKFGLMFERFLNEARLGSLPDIDCDFESLRRDDVKTYMEQRFGVHHVASIGTFSRMKLKLALKDIGRSLGIDHVKINWITSIVGDDLDDDGKEFHEIFKIGVQKNEIKSFLKDNVELLHLVEIALMQPKARSIHASGVIIVPDEDFDGNPVEIYDWMPVMKNSDGQLVTEWEMYYTEKAGFLKEDILGVNQLDKFNSIVRMVAENRGETVDVYKIPLDDERTYALFKLGLNEDVFQFGSDSQKVYCTKCLPDNIEELIAMNALYRPGPMDTGSHDDFWKIKHGQKELEVDPFMDGITGITQGLWIYQEQIMKAFSFITNANLKDADTFRKFITKMRSGHISDETYVKYTDMFIEGYTSLGVSEQKAHYVWDKMVAFSKYGFNRSHAVCYAIMGYFSQYLKVHYPLEFWSTSFQLSPEDQIFKRISEIKKLNDTIKLSGPNVNYSKIGFSSNPQKNTIYWSISSVAYCTNNSQLIIDERERNGKFFSVEDFVSRVPKSKVNSRSVFNLILSGAFDEIYMVVHPKDRLFIVQELNKVSKTDKTEKLNKDLFIYDWYWDLLQNEVCGYGDIDYRQMIATSSIKVKNYVKEKEFFKDYNDGVRCSIAGVVLFVNNKKRKDGTRFCELKLNVNNETIFATVWPDTFQRYQDQIIDSEDKLIIISGAIKYNSWKGANSLNTDEDSEIIFVK